MGWKDQLHKLKTEVFIASILLVGVWFVSVVVQTKGTESCIQSFHQFAYDGPPNPRADGVIPPDSLWEVELSLLNVPDIGRPYSLYRTELIRSVDGYSEVWISLSDGIRYFYPPESSHGREGFGIYSPHSQDFEIVSHYVDDTELYVVNLHTTSDGTVWGEVRWDNLTAYPDVNSVPNLSRFNENSRRFEFAVGILEVSLQQAQNYFNYTMVVLDHQDVFWIFADDEKIYRYDPILQRTDQQGNGLGGQVIYTALSSDGDIYFSLNEWNPDLLLSQNALFQFSTKSGELIAVEVPDTGWPAYAGLLVDRAGRLWLGAIGYRDLGNTWNLIHPPYLETYANHLGRYMWSAPKVLLESSDGRLWYNKYLDSGLWAEGTAWFNPETNEGCLVTNVPTTISEDSDQRLWMVVDGVLYSYPLNQ